MKRIYIVIAVLFILVCIIIGLALNTSKKTSQNPTIPIPTAVETAGPTNTVPSQNNSISVTPSTIFENPTIKKELDLLENRRPLVPTDTETKTNLINSISADGETIYETVDYRILYIASLDEFQVEIKTINTHQAQTEATTWLTAQGMSHDGICKLPLIFYTNITVYRQLKSQGIKDISPLAEGC